MFKKLLKKIDSFAPNPWYVDGVEQHRPLTQLVTLIIMIIGFIFFLKFAKFI